MLALSMLVVVGQLACEASKEKRNESSGLDLPDEFTAILGSFVGGETAPVKGSDGRWHVVYELWMTNGKQVPASIKKIEVLDYDDPTKVLASFADDTLDVTQLSTKPAENADLQPNESLRRSMETTSSSILATACLRSMLTSKRVPSQLRRGTT